MTREERVQYGKLTENAVIKSLVAYANDNNLPCTAISYDSHSMEDQQLKIDFSITDDSGTKHFNVKSVLPNNANTPNFTCPLSVVTEAYKLVDYIVFLEAYDPTQNMLPEYCYIVKRDDLCKLDEQNSDIMRKITRHDGSFYLINKLFIKNTAPKIKMIYD